MTRGHRARRQRAPALLVTADGAVFAGRGRRRGGARGDGRARLQHRHERVPGGDHRPVLRRTGDRLHQHRTSATTGPTPRTTRRSRRTAAASWCATWPTCRRTGAPTEGLEPFLRRHGMPGHHRRRHPPADPPRPRRAGRSRAPSAPRPRRELRGGRGGRRRHRRAWTWCRASRRAEPSVHPATGAAPDRRPARRRLRLRRQDDHGAAARRRWATVTVVPAGDHGRRGAGARARRRVPLQRPRRPGRAARPDGGGGRPGRARARSSASASATRSWPPRSAASTYKLPFGHHGGQPPGAAPRDRRRRDHEPEPQLRRRRRLGPRRRDDPRQPQRRGDRGVPRR